MKWKTTQQSIRNWQQNGNCLKEVMVTSVGVSLLFSLVQLLLLTYLTVAAYPKMSMLLMTHKQAQCDPDRSRVSFRR